MRGKGVNISYSPTMHIKQMSTIYSTLFDGSFTVLQYEWPETLYAPHNPGNVN